VIHQHADLRERPRVRLLLEKHPQGCDARNERIHVQRPVGQGRNDVVALVVVIELLPPTVSSAEIPINVRKKWPLWS